MHNPTPRNCANCQEGKPYGKQGCTVRCLRFQVWKDKDDYCTKHQFDPATRKAIRDYRKECRERRDKCAQLFLW